MREDLVRALFTRSDGAYRFARWARPLAPAVLGAEAASADALRRGIAETAALARLSLVPHDPESGANLVVIVAAEWGAFREVPHLGRLVPDLDAVLDRLGQAGANQYRSFAFDGAGAIRACTVLLRQDAEFAAVPARVQGRLQGVQSLLFWSDLAFRAESPLAPPAPGADPHVARPLARLLRAAYAPDLPDATTDPAHAARLAARAALLKGEG